MNIYPKENKHRCQPGILYRMVGAYLSYAECLNEIRDKPPAKMYEYVNLIRKWAGLPDLKGGLSKEQMRKAIQHKRHTEFNYEGVRIEDLRRWKLAEEYLNAPIYGMSRAGSVASDGPNNPKAYYKC